MIRIYHRRCRDRRGRARPRVLDQSLGPVSGDWSRSARDSIPYPWSSATGRALRSSLPAPRSSDGRRGSLPLPPVLESESRGDRLRATARRPPRKDLHPYSRCLLRGRRLHPGCPRGHSAPVRSRRSSSGIPYGPGNQAGNESVRLADLLELERLERVVCTRRASLEICAGAGALQTLRHPGDRGSGRRPRSDPCNDFLNRPPARARQACVFHPQVTPPQRSNARTPR